MSENNQLLSEWGDGSRNRIVDLIDASRIASNKPRRAQDFSDSYSELEFGYYADLSAANDLSEFKRKIEHAIRELGFQEFSYFRSQSGDADSENLMTVSSDLLTDYFSERFFEHDLILPYANSNTAPIYQSTLHDYARNAPFDINMTQMMKAIFELNKSYGYQVIPPLITKVKSRELCS